VECADGHANATPVFLFDNVCLQAQLRDANGCHTLTWSRARDYKQTTSQKSGYQWRHTTRSGRRKGSHHSRPFPTSAFRRRVTSQSALRDHPSGSSFDTGLDSRMGMKRIQPSDDLTPPKAWVPNPLLIITLFPMKVLQARISSFAIFP
jgi:hypothetical protein